MSSNKLNILFTGATGYIGGTVLSRLLNHPEFSSFNITALVRSAEKAEKFKTFGINPVVGSYDDPVLVSSLASQNDIVIATADADHFGAAAATLAGLKKRYENTGVPPIFIHTSGTGVLRDDARGEHPTDVIYDDSNPAHIDTLPDTQIHRNVDLLLLNADKEGYVKTYLVIPPTIYGLAKGALVDQGLQNPFSVQIPWLIRASIDRKKAGIIGPGKNIWNKVHVEDLADFYIILFDATRKDSSLGHGHDGYYFAETGEYIYHDVGKAIGEALVALGKAENPEHSPYTSEEVGKYFGGSYDLGSNSRCRATKARSLGWKPTHTGDFYTSIRNEVEALVKGSSG